MALNSRRLLYRREEIVPPAPGPVCGEELFTTLGAGTFVVPSLVTRVSVVCVGAGGSAMDRGGGGGGGLAWANNIAVTPGESIDLWVGAPLNMTPYLGQGAGTRPDYMPSESSWFGDPVRHCEAGGGTAMAFINSNTFGGAGGGWVGDGGGSGGRGGGSGTNMSGDAGSGGGAGGYTGNGGIGVNGSNPGGSGAGGAGGAGGCNGSGDGPAAGGGGVGVLGIGASGAGGSGSGQGGFGGSGGANGTPAPGGSGGGDGGLYGGGSAGNHNNYLGSYSPGAAGAVRVIWGTDRAGGFPANAQECAAETFVELAQSYGATAIWTFDNHDPSANVGGCLNADKLNCFRAADGGGQMWPAQILDSSGNNHTMLFRGALSGGGCSAGSGTNTRTGFGYSAFMDYAGSAGSDVACSAGGMGGFQNGFTGHFWLRPADGGNNMRWCTSSGGGTRYWQIRTTGSGPLDVSLIIRLADLTERTFTAVAAFPTPLSTGKVITVAWAPVAGDASDCSIYINSVPVGVTLNSPYTPQPLDTGASVILFNSDGFTGPNNSYYDDACVFPSKLTPGQIQSLVLSP